MTGTDDDALGRLRKRSITIAGHRTSVSLEEIFGEPSPTKPPPRADHWPN